MSLKPEDVIGASYKGAKCEDRYVNVLHAIDACVCDTCV